MRRFVRWSAWLALSLLLWTAAAESTHNHPNRTEAATCSVCVAAHTASPAAISAQDAPVFADFGLLRDEDIVAQARIDLSEQGIRGPPVV